MSKRSREDKLVYRAGLRHAPLLRCTWRKFVPDIQWSKISRLEDFPNSCVLISPLVAELTVESNQVRFEIDRQILHEVFQCYYGIVPASSLRIFSYCIGSLGLCINPKHLRLGYWYDFQKMICDERATLCSKGCKFPQLVATDSTSVCNVSLSECASLTHTKGVVRSLHWTGISPVQTQMETHNARCHEVMCGHISLEVDQFNREVKQLLKLQSMLELVQHAVALGEKLEETIVFGVECSNCACGQGSNSVCWQYYARPSCQPTIQQIIHFYAFMLPKLHLEHAEERSRFRMQAQIWMNQMGLSLEDFEKFCKAFPQQLNH